MYEERIFMSEKFINKLSSKELEVLKELVKGATNKVISARLFISLSTVKVHISSIFRKLNAQNRVDAAVKGVYLLLNINK